MIVRRPLAIAKIFVTGIMSAIALLGCRLYEPERYPRLTFAPGEKSTRVLMIGDSLTYYNDLPGILQQLSARESAPIDIQKITFPLRSLETHWEFGSVQKRIREGRFDYVILQDFSRKPVTDPEACEKYFALFDDEIRASGAKTIIFQNWTRRDFAADYPVLLNTYRTISSRIHAPIAPIGAAWKRCNELHPEISLLLDDRHPTEAGSYLAACVLYDTLYRKNASASLPLSLPAPDLPPATLATLRQVADQTSRP